MKINLEEARDQFLSGNHQLLALISEEYGLYCIRYLTSKHICSQDEARDCFGDAIIVVRDAIVSQKVEEISNVRSYLLGICLNLYRKGIEKEQKKADKVDEIRSMLYEDNSNYLDEVIARENDVELNRMVIESFRELSEGCRSILHLYYVDGLKMVEIAKQLNMASVNVAKTTKSRCYKKWMEIVDKFKNKDNV